MQRKKRLLGAALLICALGILVFAAVGIYRIWNKEPAQSAEPAAAVPEIEGVSPLYTPGAPLVPPSGDFNAAAEFKFLNAETGLYEIDAAVSGDEKLFAVGSSLYLLGGGRLSCIDVSAGEKHETAVAAGILSSGTLDDGNIWLVTATEQTALYIYTPRCEEVLAYTLHAETSPRWAEVSPYGSEAVFCFDGAVLVLDLKTGELRELPCAAADFENIHYTQTGQIIAKSAGGTVELNLRDGSIVPIPGLENAKPISGRYAAAEIGFEGIMAVYDICSPESPIFLPGESIDESCGVDGRLLLKTGASQYGGKSTRRLYDLNTGALLQYTAEGDAQVSCIAVSADFGWGAYISGGRLFLAAVDRSVLNSFSQSDGYLDVLPQTQCGEAAARIYTQTGVKVFWGEENAVLLSSGFSAEPASEEACLPVLRVVENFLTALPPGMTAELVSACAKEMHIHVCSNLRTVPDLGWSVGGFTDMIDGNICIALNVKDIYWMQGNLAHEFWHALEYRIRLLEGVSSDDYISGWSDLMPLEINALYWSQGTDGIDSQWQQSKAACGDGTDAPENIWFVRSYARSDPAEDRATVFEAMYWERELALLKECVHLGEKADYICSLLRECYPSCRNADYLPWEYNYNNF